MQNLPQRIKTTRIKLGLSQSGLAAETGVSQPTVTNWENGSHIPRKDALAKISTALGVEETWLLSGKTSPSRRSIEAYLSQPLRHIPVYAWPYPGEDLFSRAPESYVLQASARGNDFALIDETSQDPCRRILIFSPQAHKPPGNDLILWQDGTQAALDYSANMPPTATILAWLMTEIRHYA